MKTFRQFLNETPQIDAEYSADKAGAADNRRSDFNSFEHISTMPSGHRVFKEKDVSLDSTDEPHVFLVAHPKKDIKELRLMTFKTLKGHHRVAWLGGYEGGSAKAHDFYHHLITHHNIRLASDTTQSVGGAKVWHKLSEMPGIKMTQLNKNNKQLPLASPFEHNYGSDKGAIRLHAQKSE